jgi:ABC-type cobalamin/Fe3+-siderophores transport system ATPase subunit
MAYRGLYHHPEGNESRNTLLIFQEHDADNEVVEGEVVTRFRAMMQNFIKTPDNRNKQIIEDYIQKLKNEGFLEDK